MLVTHVPGGIGVFEAVVLATVPGDRPGLFAALLLYRVIYYLLPLAGAAGLLGVLEGRRLRRPIAVGVSMVEQASRALAPPLLAALVFTGGLVLLVSGALPAVHDRIFWLADVLPLPFIEASHFSASLAGTCADHGLARDQRAAAQRLHRRAAAAGRRRRLLDPEGRRL